MKLYFYGLIMVIRKFILRQNTGRVVCSFAAKMGVVYIKVAQILAMQNVGEVFTEADREQLSQICDHCNPLPFSKIQRQLEREYGCPLSEKFQSIDPEPLGSASISQVHRAVLKTGEVVAVKVKRSDVSRRINRDIRQIRSVIHRFGRFVSFRNFLGSDKALDCYLDWIVQETDFANERQNITSYQAFADSVNGKIPGTVQIKAPRLFSDFCTENVIVMEFISTPTINKLPLNEANKRRIAQAENDYIRLSFYALFHDMPVIFHGDPHGGNIYLDETGNIGFLDMGLIFQFSSEESHLTRQLFLNAYTGKIDRIVDYLFTDSEFEGVDRTALMRDMQAKIVQLHGMPVAQFFVEMIGVFTQYNMAVPPFLFKMAKAFLALFGLGMITGNIADTKSLLADQVADFYLRRAVNDVREVCRDGLCLAPRLMKTTFLYGPLGGISASLNSLAAFGKQLQVAAENCHEAIDLLGTEFRLQ